MDITVSVDGFVTAPNDGPGLGLGEGGRVLHEWVFEQRTERDAAVLDEAIRTTGAVVLGRRTFDIAEPGWGDDEPFPGPIFVVTHRAPSSLRRGRRRSPSSPTVSIGPWNALGPLRGRGTYA